MWARGPSMYFYMKAICLDTVLSQSWDIKEMWCNVDAPCFLWKYNVGIHKPLWPFSGRQIRFLFFLSKSLLLKTHHVLSLETITIHGVKYWKILKACWIIWHVFLFFNFITMNCLYVWQDRYEKTADDTVASVANYSNTFTMLERARFNAHEISHSLKLKLMWQTLL